MNELPGLRRWRLWRLISNCLVSLLDRGRLRFRQLNIGLSLGEEAGSSFMTDHDLISISGT